MDVHAVQTGFVTQIDGQRKNVDVVLFQEILRQIAGTVRTDFDGLCHLIHRPFNHLAAAANAAKRQFAASFWASADRETAVILSE